MGVITTILSWWIFIYFICIILGLIIGVGYIFKKVRLKTIIKSSLIFIIIIIFVLFMENIGNRINSSNTKNEFIQNDYKENKKISKEADIRKQQVDIREQKQREQKQKELDKYLEQRQQAIANIWHYYAMQEAAARRAEYRARVRVKNNKYSNTTKGFEQCLSDIVAGELGDVIDTSLDYDEQYTKELLEIWADRDRVNSGRQKYPTDFNAIF